LNSTAWLEQTVLSVEDSELGVSPPALTGVLQNVDFVRFVGVEEELASPFLLGTEDKILMIF
jgi:hypothetical protein